MGRQNDPSGIADILASLKRDPKLGKQFELAKIWRHWPEVVGADLAPYGQPLGVRDNTLLVEVASSGWMHRFAAEKWRILHRISGLIGNRLVQEIFLVLTEEVPDGLHFSPPQDDVD